MIPSTRSFLKQAVENMCPGPFLLTWSQVLLVSVISVFEMIGMAFMPYFLR